MSHGATLVSHPNNLRSHITSTAPFSASLLQHCVSTFTSRSLAPCAFVLASSRPKSLQRVHLTIFNTIKIVAFSHLAFALAITNFSYAQSFNSEIPSNIPSGMPPVGTGMLSGHFPSGAAQPSGHMHGGHGHRGPRPSGVTQAQRAHRSEAPFGTGMPSGFPSGMARPTGSMHDGHGGHGSKLPELTESFFAIPTGLEKRQESGMLSGTPSGFKPPHGPHSRPTGMPSSAMPPHGVRPTGARPSGMSRGTCPSGAVPTDAPRPSGIATVLAPSGLFTSVVCV
ncbi:hypothetical protein G6011_02369 [Alternaria panax]|uniref:Uncharacterized protein n=1 Tax=Alternaria panax TaxID=48097 RepID=A0AAD4FGU9_9PLEO|nr:hypothetical protein G6011_02369 [Alternaria panax]